MNRSFTLTQNNPALRVRRIISVSGDLTEAALRLLNFAYNGEGEIPKSSDIKKQAWTESYRHKEQEAVERIEDENHSNPGDSTAIAVSSEDFDSLGMAVIAAACTRLNIPFLGFQKTGNDVDRLEILHNGQRLVVTKSGVAQPTSTRA